MVFKNVERYCKEHNISICQFEKENDIGNGTIGKWKNGRNPSLGTLKKLAEATGMPIAELLGDAEGAKKGKGNRAESRTAV